MRERIQQIRQIIVDKWLLLKSRLNRIRPVFLGRAGLADILVFFLKGLTHRRFTLNAMAMAYRFFFAIFPGLILVFTLIPKIPIPDLQQQVTTLLSTVIPGDSVSFIDSIVGEFFTKPSAGLIYINVALLLFTTMGGIKAMMSAFSKDSEHFTRRNIFHFNFIAFVLLLGLLVIFLGTIGLMVLQEYSILRLEEGKVIDGQGWEATLVRAGYWILIFLSVLIAVSLLYFLGPATRRRGRFFSPGAIVSSVMILLAVTFFKLFFSQFSNYNKVYGSISAIMVLMVWFYWISICLLIGFELNAAVLAASSEAIVEGDDLDVEIKRRREGPITDERRSTRANKK